MNLIYLCLLLCLTVNAVIALPVTAPAKSSSSTQRSGKSQPKPSPVAKPSTKPPSATKAKTPCEKNPSNCKKEPPRKGKDTKIKQQAKSQAKTQSQQQAKLKAQTQASKSNLPSINDLRTQGKTKTHKFDPVTKVWTDAKTGQRLQEANNKVTALPQSAKTPNEPSIDYLRTQGKTKTHKFDPVTKVWTDTKTGQRFQEANNKVTAIPNSANTPILPSIDYLRTQGKTKTHKFDPVTKVWTDTKTGQRFQEANNKVTAIPNSASTPILPSIDYLRTQGKTKTHKFDPVTKVWTDTKTGQRFQEANNKVTAIPNSANTPILPSIDYLRTQGSQKTHAFTPETKVWTDLRTGQRFKEANNRVTAIPGTAKNIPNGPTLFDLRNGAKDFSFDPAKKIWTNTKTGEKIQEENQQIRAIGAPSTKNGDSTQPAVAPNKGNTKRIQVSKQPAQQQAQLAQTTQTTQPAQPPRPPQSSQASGSIEKPVERTPSPVPKPSPQQPKDNTDSKPVGVPNIDNKRQATSAFAPNQNKGGLIPIGAQGKSGFMDVKKGTDKDSNPAMTSSELKQMVNEVAGNDKPKAALIMASAVQESSGGKSGTMQSHGRPTASEQASRKDTAGNIKLGADSQEVSMYRMSREMIREIAAEKGQDTENAIAKMDSNTRQGDRLATEYMRDALQKYGRDGFLIAHRQGLKAYKSMPKGSDGQVHLPTQKLAQDQEKFYSDYFTLQRSILEHGLLDDGTGKLPFHEGSAELQ